MIVVFSAVCSVALTLALLHLLFFLFESRDRLDLYFAALSTAFAAVVFLDYHERTGAPLEAPVVGELQRFAISALILLAARFVYGRFLDRPPRRFWLYLGLIAALLLASIVERSLFPLPAGLLGLVIIADLLILLVRRRRTLDGDAWILGLGAGAFSLGGGLQLLLDLLDAPALGNLLNPYLWGGIAMLLATSVYLARSFTRTRRDLERRLVEVRELSRQRLEQERAAREEEVRRRLLEADNRRKTGELEAARELQLSLLPSAPPEVPGLEIAARMRTATEVGGDFYDFHAGAEGGLTVAVADAVGHGARAGTLVAAVKSLFELAAGDQEPARQLERFSAALRRMGLPRAHVCLALAHLRDGRLRVASAGMPPVLVRRTGDGSVEELPAGGLPLGGPLSGGYESSSLAIGPGDVVLLLSDGLPELPDRAGTPLGYDAVRALLAGAGEGSADAVADALLEAADTRTGGAPPADDVTLVALRLRP